MRVEVDRYGWDELATIPALPGLYAWYMDVELREADIADYASSVENLRRVALRLRLPQLTVEAGSHLSLRFLGDLQHDHVGGDQQDFTRLTHKVLESEPHRRLFAQVLCRATPLLTAPLYIGVATNLRDRIRTHRRLIEGLDGDPGSDVAQSFAREVTARQIPYRKLVVYVLPMPGVEVPLEREIAEAVESVLNRLFFPILGRR